MDKDLQKFISDIIQELVNVHAEISQIKLMLEKSYLVERIVLSDKGRSKS